MNPMRLPKHCRKENAEIFEEGDGREPFCMEDHRLPLRWRTGESDEYQGYQSVSVGLEHVRKD